MQPESQSTLDVIYENWRGYNKRLQNCIAPLTDEQLLLRPAPRMWPLGQVVQHIISVRVGWFCYTLQDPDAGMEAYGSWGQRESPERSASERSLGERAPVASWRLLTRSSRERAGRTGSARPGGAAPGPLRLRPRRVSSAAGGSAAGSS